MQIYIPGTYRAALMALKRGSDTDIRRIDAIDARHRAIANRLFDGLMSGEFSEAHLRYNGPWGLMIFHKSTSGEHIQASCFLRDTDGDWIAQSHRDIYCPDDIELQPATRITISTAA